MLPYYMTYDLSILKFEFRASQTLKQQNAHLPRSITIFLYHDIPFFQLEELLPTIVHCNCWQQKFPICAISCMGECAGCCQDAVPNVIAIAHCGQSLAYISAMEKRLKGWPQVIIFWLVSLARVLRKCVEWLSKILEYLTEDVCSMFGVIDRDRIVWQPPNST